MGGMKEYRPEKSVAGKMDVTESDGPESIGSTTSTIILRKYEKAILPAANPVQFTRCTNPVRFYCNWEIARSVTPH